MENVNFQTAFSEAAQAYVSDMNQVFSQAENNQGHQQNKQSNEQKPNEKEENLTKAEVEKMLEAHFAKIEKLISTQEKQIDHLPEDTPKEKVTKKTEGFFSKLKEARQEFTATVKYLVADMTDNTRLKIKNGINRRVLRISSALKRLGEKMDQKFAIEKKVERIDPRAAKVQATLQEQEKQAAIQKQEEQAKNTVEIDVSKHATVTFDPPKINEQVNLTKQEVDSLTQSPVYDFKKVSELAFNKRAAQLSHNWQSHQERFGDKDLSQAWKVFMKDAWDIQTAIVPMLHSELAATWEKEYYDFFYEGGKEAYDTSIVKGTELNYSPEAMKYFEELYDRQVAVAMQENLAQELNEKRSQAPVETAEAIPTDHPLPQEQAAPTADINVLAEAPEAVKTDKTPTATKVTKASGSVPNKFEQRKAAAIEKNKAIEKNLVESEAKQVVNAAPTMK